MLEFYRKIINIFSYFVICRLQCFQINKFMILYLEFDFTNLVTLKQYLSYKTEILLNFDIAWKVRK